MTSMRAKVRVSAVFPIQDGAGNLTGERLQLHGASKSGAYPADGSDEDNSFAKWSPSVSMDFHIANPALFGKFKVGDTFYSDFSPALQQAVAA